MADNQNQKSNVTPKTGNATTQPGNANTQAKPQTDMKNPDAKKDDKTSAEQAAKKSA
jgi:hypothetical protein